MAEASWAGGAYTPVDASHKFQVLQRRCEEAGRPYSSILRATHFSPLILAETEARVQAKLDRFAKAVLAFLEQTVLATTPDDSIRRMQTLVDVGFQYFLCGIAGKYEETLTLLAQQVIPAIVACSVHLTAKLAIFSTTQLSAIQLNTGERVSRLLQAAPIPLDKPQLGNTRSHPAVTSYHCFIMKHMSKSKKEKGSE